MTPGAHSASLMCPAKWQNAVFAMRFASFTSSVIPHRRMFSTEILRRFPKNGQNNAAKPQPNPYACLCRMFIATTP